MIPLEYKRKASQFDISYSALDSGESIEFIVNYKTGVFSEETVKYITNAYFTLIQKVIINPRLRISDYKIFTYQNQNS
jgi:hypothetical protein